MTTTCYNELDPSDPLTIDGQQLTGSLPTADARVAGIDWDKPKSVRISLPGQPIFGLSPSAFLTWYREEAYKVCDVICFERPHLRARGDFSRAQVWTADDLEKLVGGPPIRMPNGKKLHKMAAFAGNVIETRVKQSTGGYKSVMKPDKPKDSDSIRQYAQAYPEIRSGWKLFVPPSKDTSLKSHEHRDALRRDISRTINEWREAWQDVSGKDDTRDLEFVRPAAAILDEIFNDLSKDCKAVFKLTRSKGTVNLTMGRTRVMTVYAMAFDIDNNLRLHHGRPMGRDYLMKDVIGLCDSYMPSMARANLTGYGTTGLASVERRARLNRAVKELLRAFQAHGDRQDPLTIDEGVSV